MARFVLVSLCLIELPGATAPDNFLISEVPLLVDF